MLICRGNSSTIGDCQYLKMLCGLLNQYPSSDLSFTLYSFVSFYALSDYGKAMVQQYFAWTMGDTLYIDYLLLSQDGSKLLFEQICTRVSDGQWIQLGKLIRIFPRIRCVHVRNIDLDDAVFYNILDFLLYEREISGYTRSHLWTRKTDFIGRRTLRSDFLLKSVYPIVIHANGDNAPYMVNKFREEFAKIGYAFTLRTGTQFTILRLKHISASLFLCRQQS
eukprot:955799_1